MTIIFDGTNGITSPGGDTSNTSHSTPIVRSPSSLTLQTNGSTTAVTIDTSQNVGIGTVSPQMRVDVSGGVRVQSITNPTSGSGMELAYDGTQGIIQAYSNRTTLASVPVYLVTGQLRFPPTQNPSSDANTLDDYEEGTFAPTYNTSNSNANVTYSVNAGWYVKIGQLVNFGFQINFATVTSAGTGDVQFRGLPFAFSSSGNANNGGRYVLQTSDLNATSYQNMYAYGPGGTVLQILGQTNNASWSVLSPSTFTVRAGSIITVIGFYNV